MRKLFSLLLALSLMSGACVMAGAEGDTQIYKWSDYSYEIPADWYIYDGADTRDEAHCVTMWVSDDEVSIDEDLEYWPVSVMICLYQAEALGWQGYELPDLVQVVHGSSDLIYLERILENGLCLTWTSIQQDVNLETIYALMFDGSVCMRVDFRFDSGFNMMQHEEIKTYIIDNVIVPICNSLKSNGEAVVNRKSTDAPDAQEDVVTESVQPQEGKQIVQLANASFELDANLVSIKNNGSMYEGANDQYDLTLMCVDWDAEGIDIGLTDDDQIDNAFWCSYLLFQDQDIASTIAEYSLPMDCDMPDGGDVMFMKVGTYVVLTHYYENTGFMMLLDPVNDADTEGLLLAGLEIAKAFRPNGMTEEDLRVDAATIAAAEASAAAQTAAEAASMKYVVITADSGKIRSEASISGGLIKTAYKGETFVLLEEITDWYIVDVDGRTGYIHQGVAAIQ